MGVKGRRVHMIEEMSDTIISFQRGSNFSVTVVFLTNSLVVLTLKLTLLDTNSKIFFPKYLPNQFVGFWLVDSAKPSNIQNVFVLMLFSEITSRI